jgi:copper chaperone CopZ
MVKTVLGVDGMMCSMCESHVNEAVRKSCEVKKVISDHKKGETVIFSQASLDADQLKASIAATGYRVTWLREEPYRKKGWFPLGR